MNLTGRMLPLMQPGSPDWQSRMSASKIAAVVGLSPYESRFSVWHKMAGQLDQPADNDTFRRGHYLEPAVAAWFADQHPDWRVEATGTWVAAGAEWMAASPDRLATLPNGTVELVEIKTASDTDGWGAVGTGEIPPGYRAQVQWQMLVTGARRCHVAVLSAYLVFTEYVVDFDPLDAGWIADAAAEFMATLPGGVREQRPNLDGHAATYAAIRQMHPSIDGLDVELPVDVADRYCFALAQCKDAETEKRAATAAVADHMGAARRGLVGDLLVARRQSKADGTPFITPGRNLPASLEISA